MALVRTTGQTNIASDAALADGASLTIYTTTGPILQIASAPTAGGTGYSVGDIVTVTTGGVGGRVQVLTVSVGVVQTMVQTPVSAGSGYTTGAGKVTSGGNGDLTVNISSIVVPQVNYTIRSITLAPINSSATTTVGKVEVLDGSTSLWTGYHTFIATATTQSDAKYFPINVTFTPQTSLLVKYTNVTAATTASVTVVYQQG